MLKDNENEEIDRILSVDKVRQKDEQDEEIVRLFKRVFSTREGRIVFNQILIDLKYYDECITETDTALNNYAKFMINTRLRCNNQKYRSDAIIDSVIKE